MDGIRRDSSFRRENHVVSGAAHTRFEKLRVYLDRRSRIDQDVVKRRWVVDEVDEDRCVRTIPCDTAEYAESMVRNLPTQPVSTRRVKQWYGEGSDQPRDNNLSIEGRKEACDRGQRDADCTSA